MLRVARDLLVRASGITRPDDGRPVQCGGSPRGPRPEVRSDSHEMSVSNPDGARVRRGRRRSVGAAAADAAAAAAGPAAATASAAAADRAAGPAGSAGPGRQPARLRRAETGL